MRAIDTSEEVAASAASASAPAAAAQTPDGQQRSRRSEHPDLPAEKAHLAGVVAAIDKRIVELDVPRPKVKNWALHSAWRLKIASRDRLEKARPEPYFGRVDFAPADHAETESHRIGRFAAPGITDWRAPVASLMYSRAQGGVDTYTSPDGDVTGQVSLRRHYLIERAELQEIFDARVEDRILSALAGEPPDGDADRSDDPYLVARYNLVRNYRSTRQIVSLAQEVLRRAATGLTAPEPVARDGPPVQMHACSDPADAARCVERVVRDLAGRHRSVAVIAPDDVSARRLASTLGTEDLGFELHVGARARRRGTRVVLPLEMARGLEFDAVLVVEADTGRYPAGQVSGRRLYTAVTRALHELAVVWWGQRSPLLPQD